MLVKLIKFPTDEQLRQAKQAALATVGKTIANDPNGNWLYRIADAEHSPIRRLEYRFQIIAPYWVLNELRTHHVGCEMYMQSSRNDRQSEFDRNDAPQGMQRICEFDCNLQSLMDICHKRLCCNASEEMHALAIMMASAVQKEMSWTIGLFLPMCEYRGGLCHEMKSCGKYPHA